MDTDAIARIISPMQREALYALGYVLVKRPTGDAGTQASDVIRAAAQTWGIAPSDVTGPRRRKAEAEARQAAMLLMHERGYSASEAARRLGRDDTSVLYGQRAARRKCGALAGEEFAVKLAAARALAAEMTAQRMGER